MTNEGTSGVTVATPTNWPLTMLKFLAEAEDAAHTHAAHIGRTVGQITQVWLGTFEEALSSEVSFVRDMAQSYDEMYSAQPDYRPAYMNVARFNTSKEQAA